MLFYHSTADIITNSSSELFICQCSLSVKEVKQVLESIRQITEEREERSLPPGLGVGEIKVFKGLDGFLELIKDQLDGWEEYYVSALCKRLFPYGVLSSMPEFTSYEEMQRLNKEWETINIQPPYNLKGSRKKISPAWRKWCTKSQAYRAEIRNRDFAKFRCWLEENRETIEPCVKNLIVISQRR